MNAPPHLSSSCNRRGRRRQHAKELRLVDASLVPPLNRRKLGAICCSLKTASKNDVCDGDGLAHNESARDQVLLQNSEIVELRLRKREPGVDLGAGKERLATEVQVWSTESETKGSKVERRNDDTPNVPEKHSPGRIPAMNLATDPLPNTVPSVVSSSGGCFGK
jgi:hypothetical protein